MTIADLQAALTPWSDVVLNIIAVSIVMKLATWIVTTIGGED